MSDRHARITGLQLSQRFYTQVVAPQLTGIAHSAAARLARRRRTGDLDTLDWLLVPQQRLLGVTAGAVVADPTVRLVTLYRPHTGGRS